MSRPAILILIVATVAVVPAPAFGQASDNGATLYQAKCAACHGVDGAGKPAARIPSLISDEARKATDADLTDGIANGGISKKAAHAFQPKAYPPIRSG